MIDELENEILETRVIVSKYIFNEQNNMRETNQKLKEEIHNLQSSLEASNNDLSKNKMILYHIPYTYYCQCNNIFSAFSLESNALKGPLWLAGPLARCLKNSAGEARRDFGFFALNSCYFVGVRNVFSFLKLPS